MESVITPDAWRQVRIALRDLVLEQVRKACDEHVAKVSSEYEYSELYEYRVRNAKRRMGACFEETRLCLANFVEAEHVLTSLVLYEEFRTIVTVKYGLDPCPPGTQPAHSRFWGSCRQSEDLVTFFANILRYGVGDPIGGRNSGAEFLNQPLILERQEEAVVPTSGDYVPRTAVHQTAVTLERLKPAKRRGRLPDRRRREIIRNAIQKRGPGWRSFFTDILEELDAEGASLGCLQGEKIDLGGGEVLRVSKWADFDFADGEQRARVLGLLRKYVRFNMGINSN
jgi:hypothetical protein